MNILKAFVGAVVACVVLGVILIIGAVMWWSATYNSLVHSQEAVNASWGQVQNVYQRRTDLIPNLVSTVKAAANHEEDTLVKVTQARQQVMMATTGVEQASKETGPDAQKHIADSQQQWITAQQGLTTALSGMKITIEKYPDLKANQNFLTLQDQLEGTENRITVERQNNQKATEAYNNLVQGFMSGMVASHYHFTTRPYFTAVAGSDVAPKVNFDK